MIKALRPLSLKALCIIQRTTNPVKKHIAHYLCIIYFIYYLYYPLEFTILLFTDNPERNNLSTCNQYLYYYDKGEMGLTQTIVVIAPNLSSFRWFCIGNYQDCQLYAMTFQKNVFAKFLIHTHLIYGCIYSLMPNISFARKLLLLVGRCYCCKCLMQRMSYFVHEKCRLLGCKRFLKHVDRGSSHIFYLYCNISVILFNPINNNRSIY